MATKTDAKGQRTEYSYDIYGRMTQERHYTPQNAEKPCERVDYRYDSYEGAPSGYSDQAVGTAGGNEVGPRRPGGLRGGPVPRGVRLLEPLPDGEDAAVQTQRARPAKAKRC